MRENKYRPTPFWIMNDKLDKEELKRQAKFLSDKGFGGAFFHSSTCLRTPYLSDEWFDCIKSAMETIKENRGYLWLYDEDTWPSGNAGGKVAGKRENNRAACIRVEFVPIGDKPNNMTKTENSDNYKFLCAYRLHGRENHTPNIEILSPKYIDETPEIENFDIITLKEAEDDINHERLIVRKEYAPKIPWWSGQSYSNILETRAVSDFIEETHEKYKAKLGQEFGKTIPGIYTDEPQVMTGYNVIAWWDDLPKTYKEKWGSSLWEDLPFMFFNHKKAYRARLQINRTILERFVENFDKRIYNWCEENSLFMTGHYNCEDTFMGQIRNQYGSVMAHYRYNHIPGIDHLGRQVEGLEGDEFCTLLSGKQAVSVANQTGKKRVMDEIWGVFRHTGAFKDYKWIGDHEVALGINFFVTHFANYSMRGRRKRQYPPVYNYQEPFMHHIKPLVEYYANLTDIMSQGEAVADVLLINTIESAVALNKRGFLPQTGLVGDWTFHNNYPCDINRENSIGVQYLDSDYRKTLKAILDMGLTCEIGDEGYIEDLGKVEDNSFIIGERTYKLVVVPPFITLREKTVDLLTEFAKAGGKILFVGKIGDYIWGERSDRIKSLLKFENVYFSPISKTQIEHNIDKIYSTDYSLRGLDGKPVEKTIVNIRDIDVPYKGRLFFVYNRDNSYKKEYVLKVSDYKYLYKIDPLTKEFGFIKTVSGPFGISGKIALGGVDSALIFATNEEIPCDILEPFDYKNIIEIKNPDITLLGENICVIDNISYSLDAGKTFTKPENEAFARQKIAKHFGTEDALNWQGYVCDSKEEFKALGGPVILRYEVTSLIEKDIRLMAENLNGGVVKINGKEIEFGKDWLFDRSFRIGNCHINKGLNVIEHYFDYDYLSDIEKIYLLGDFGVEIKEGSKVIITETKSLKFGSVIDQGMPFYSNEIKYSFKVEIPSNKAILRLKRCVANCFEIKVNGQSVFSWSEEVDISDYVHQGENEIEILLVLSLQNAFGPIHDKLGDDDPYVRWTAFEDKKVLTNNYVLYDYGLGGVEILF